MTMEATAKKQAWERKIEENLMIVSDILGSIGFSLDKEQPHISGERFLMTRDKLVLVGKAEKDGKRVIIKISSHPDGQKEINQEKRARDFLSDLSFSDDTILFPQEIYFGMIKSYLIWICKFIPQDKVFVAHTLEEQFFLILRAFEAQEAFHATTLEHKKNVENVFETFLAEDYLKDFADFKNIISKNYDDGSLIKTMNQAEKVLRDNGALIKVYCNYLTHTDFVPHNFRVKDHLIYMLDCSAIHFGNKYEGWARFLNYMTIHNPDLEHILSEYVLKNRGKEEYENLQLMRIYKIGFLLKYYAESIKKTSGDLHNLTKKRIEFWHQMMSAVMENKFADKEIIEQYKKERDNLRSEEEKRRQKEFAVA
jgi:hypothetical protein